MSRGFVLFGATALWVYFGLIRQFKMVKLFCSSRRLFSLCSSLQDLDCYVIDNHGFVLVSKQQNDVSAIAQTNVSPSLLWLRPNWCCFSFLIGGAIPGGDRRLGHDDIDPNGHVQKVLTCDGLVDRTSGACCWLCVVCWLPETAHVHRSQVPYIKSSPLIGCLHRMSSILN